MLPLPLLFNTSILPELPLEGIFSTASMPTVITRMYPGHCVVNSEMYILNGWRGSILNSFQKYNPQTNKVTALTGNAAGGFAQTMCHYDGKIYVHHSAGTIYIYNISLNSWSTVTPTGFTGATSEYCTSAIIGNIMYIHGGYVNSTNYKNRLYAYNVLTNVWSELASSPINTTHGLQGVYSEIIEYNGMLYLCSSNGLHRYNPNTNTWSTINSSVVYGKMCINRDILYVLNVADSNAFMAYNFNSNAWSKVGTSTLKIYTGALMGSEEDSTEIYSIGGSLNASTAIGTIYKIT